MKTIGKIIGYLMWIGAGILMFIFWFMAMSKWLGFIGGVLAIVLTPGLVIFPVVFWIVEGVFPAFKKRNKREGLSPSDILAHYVRYLLEGASVLRIYSFFLRKRNFIRGVLIANFIKYN